MDAAIINFAFTIATGSFGILGVVYNFCTNIVASIASGDRDELISVALSLVVIYVSLLILGRALRIMWSTLKLAFRLSLLVLIIFGIIQSVQLGPAATITRITELAGSFSRGFDYARANKDTLRIKAYIDEQFGY